MLDEAARRTPFRWSGAVAILLASTVLTGGLGAPYGLDEVPFDALQREHFDALAVQHTRAEPTAAPLVLRVKLLGDADAASVAKAAAWLHENVNVVLMTDANGAPLYLTASDLSATSGRATLGATLRTGMAVEIRNPAVAPCVLTHEILHFLGLRHDEDPGNIMSPHCTPHKLDHATIRADQVDHVARLNDIRAATPGGAKLWAERLR